ncbi:MAG TPA: DUF3995 domain-containing protein [Chitinophagaceae bacterium]|jgi:hypothetical protein|nr:DUF3995 domain-containing protein [Chitinophagaceae bacterium]
MKIVKNYFNYGFKKSLKMIPVIINTVIFSLLSILHFYWSFGGKLWYDKVLPTSSNGLNTLNPSSAARFAVAVGLLFFALITAGTKGLFDPYINRTYFRYGALVIALIFFLRAMGDFKFVGFSKRVKETKFAIADTQIFSPLCLFIAVLSVLIFIGTSKPI